jgi:cytochrome c5
LAVSGGIGTLYASAVKGVVTPNTEMPPRGGNTKLSDSEVRMAVDYMIAISTGIRSQP